MNKTPVAVAVAAIISIGLGMPLWAEPTSSDTEPQGMPSEKQTEMNRLDNSAMQKQSMHQSTTAKIDPRAYDDKEVITAKGDTVGKVSRLVVSNNDQAVYAIVSVGGILGMGEKDVAIPLTQLQSQGDKLILSAGITEDSLENKMEYEQSEFSAFEPMMETSPTE